MGMVAVIALTGCEKIEPAPEPEPVNPEEAAASGVYVLCEGLFQMNNATLTFYNYLTGDIDNNYFLTQNGRGLGDTGNDLKAYGSKLYCVVNASETVEIMELKSAKSLKQISLSGKQPRRIAFADGYAYVCCFNGDVVKIDTATMEVTATAQAGSNPDGICTANGKLYVANSAGSTTPTTATPSACSTSPPSPASRTSQWSSTPPAWPPTVRTMCMWCRTAITARFR